MAIVSHYAQRVRSAVRSLPEILQPSTRTRGHRSGPPRSYEEVGFAPVRPVDQVCLSLAGRWRAEHLFDRDGRCIFCSGVEAR